MASRLYFERGHAVVGGHLFSPLPQKRLLGDSLMQESRIFPCDRAAHPGSPLIRKTHDAEPILTSSIVETESLVSSCMLTSESFYGQAENSQHRCDRVFDSEPFHQESVKQVVDVILMEQGVGAQPVKDSPPSKLKNRNVNWGDRNSVRLSIELPQSLAAEFTPDVTGKGDNLSYFKICFGTEFSDDDDNEGDVEKEEKTAEGREIISQIPERKDVPVNHLASSMTGSFEKKQKKPLVKVSFLSSTTSNLIGFIESEDGLVPAETLANLSLPQIQLIVNDLLNEVNRKNRKLVEELALRDDLSLEREEKKSYLDRFVTRNRINNSPFPGRYCTSPLGRNRPIIDDAFNPNPEYRYPFNTPPPPKLSDCQCYKQKPPTDADSNTVAPAMGSRLKACITRFFGSRRSYPSRLLTYHDANLKSLSF